MNENRNLFLVCFVLCQPYFAIAAFSNDSDTIVMLERHYVSNCRQKSKLKNDSKCRYFIQQLDETSIYAVYNDERANVTNNLKTWKSSTPLHGMD